jgi:hypothetical protein
VIALIKEGSVIEAILDSLYLPSTSPAVKPSWWERGQALIFGWKYHRLAPRVGVRGA